MSSNKGTTTPPLQANEQHAGRLGRNNGVEKIAVTLPPFTAGQSSDGLDDSKRSKLDEVLTACRDQDINALKALATSNGGLVNDHARRAACTSLAQPMSWPD